MCPGFPLEHLLGNQKFFYIGDFKHFQCRNSFVLVVSVCCASSAMMCAFFFTVPVLLSVCVGGVLSCLGGIFVCLWLFSDDVEEVLMVN